jgi:uncharacterized SAM-binding protein YcdF (DUF218 family)
MPRRDGMMAQNEPTSPGVLPRPRGHSRLAAGLAALTLGSAATFGLLHAGTVLVVNVPVAAPDAIVSLASHEWERLPVTARLACQFPKSRVILTLPPYASRNNCHDCSNRLQTLMTYGVRRDRIAIVPITQSSTYGEALAVRDYMRRTGLRSLLIVTSTYHTHRALATFRAALEGNGAVVGVMPADQQTYARPSRWWTRPYDRWYVTYEWSAVFWYRVRHGVPIRINDVAWRQLTRLDAERARYAESRFRALALNQSVAV